MKYPEVDLKGAFFVIGLGVLILLTARSAAKIMSEFWKPFSLPEKVLTVWFVIGGIVCIIFGIAIMHTHFFG